MVKYLLILVIGAILLGLGVYFFTPYFKTASLTNPLSTEATPTPYAQSDVEGESLELDLTALDRDLDEADNLETEFNTEVNNF
jgi:hypothetical protein